MVSVGHQVVVGRLADVGGSRYKHDKLLIVCTTVLLRCSSSLISAHWWCSAYVQQYQEVFCFVHTGHRILVKSDTISTLTAAVFLLDYTS